MTTGTVTPPRPAPAAGRESFWYVVHAEWTKLRTVRGWVIALVVAIAVITAFVFLASNVSHSCGGTDGGTANGGLACPPPPAGPGGEPVQDAFYLAHQSLTGNGTITAQITSLTGQTEVGQTSNGQPEMAPGLLQPWFKAGIIIKQNTSQGSAYAAMVVTGSHGVRMQWDYIDDTPGMTGNVSASSPRWLRLVRDGDTITGYDSADGSHWTQVGAAILPGLTATVQGGLFAAAPSSNGAGTTATGAFRDIGLSWPATGWTGTNVGGFGAYGVGLPGTLFHSAGTLTVTGSGDISPDAGDGVLSIQRALAGTFFGLILLIVVGAIFMTAEYRRGLIRVSLTASPRRGRLLAAKAVVLGAVSFVTGLIAATLAIAIGRHTLGGTGTRLWPVPALTEVRMVVGTGALLAVAAVLALAIGTIVRRSAPAITTAVVLIFIPYLLPTDLLPSLALAAHHPGAVGGEGEWLLQITPAAALSVQQAVPRFSQVSAQYTPNGGYFPLGPWTGFAVECAWAVAALALAWYLLRRRDV
jgi:ABC-type transport system involved in multi-copper enzyme maturation permease subunit